MALEDLTRLLLSSATSFVFSNKRKLKRSANSFYLMILFYTKKEQKLKVAFFVVL